MDEQQFVAVFRNHLQDISRYLARRVEKDRVEDLASDIFEIAWKKRSQCPSGFELPWLYRIAGYVLANDRRKAKNRFPHLPLLDHDQAAASAEDIALDGSEVAIAFRQLSDSDRQILTLYTFEDLSVSELAIALGVSANTASQKLKRARQRLADKLSEIVSENT